MSHVHVFTPQFGMYASLALAGVCLLVATQSRGKVYQSILLVLATLLLVQTSVLAVAVNLGSGDVLTRVIGLVLALLAGFAGWWVGWNVALLALSSAYGACKAGYVATNKEYAHTLTTWSSPLPKPFQPEPEVAAKTGCNGGDPAVEQ